MPGGAGEKKRDIARVGVVGTTSTAPAEKTPNHVAVELCAGLGGIGIGLRALGFHVAKAYDSWEEAVAVYNHNFDSVASTCNLLSEKGRTLIKAERRRLGPIDLVAAGPPCKGFSQLRNGRHDGRNGHNRVLMAMPDYMAILRPRMFLIENVPTSPHPSYGLWPNRRQAGLVSNDLYSLE
jgi:hypothetical protein